MMNEVIYRTGRCKTRQKKKKKEKRKENDDRVLDERMWLSRSFFDQPDEKKRTQTGNQVGP